MPPSQNPTQDQTTAISTFADDLLNHIAQPNSSGQLHVPCNIIETLDRYLDQLPLFSGPVPVSTRRQLDERGVELWNECRPLIARSQEDERSGILAKVRTFAFALLDCVALRYGPGNSRVLDISLKTARTCLENNQLDLVLKILKIAAVRLDALEKSGGEVDTEYVCSVTTDYYMLRIHLAWLQGRPDIADHLFSKVPHGVSEEDGRIVLETCYRVGMLALSNGEYNTANIWLRRAMDSSDGFRGGSNPVLKDLRLLVLHSFVRVNSHIDSACSRDNLSRSLDSLKAEYGNVLAALILRLEILSKDDELNYQEFFEVLRAAIQTIVLTEENLKLVSYYIQKLRNWSLELSVEALKELLLEHLAPSDKTLWMEQSIVTLIWMLTTSVSPLKNNFDVITDIVKRLTEFGREPLSEEATHASLVLIWRNIASARSNSNQHDAERWCTLVLEQPIFQHCSQANKAKLQKKSIASALKASNTSRAREILSLVDQDSRSDPLMLYLIYKLSLLDEDFQLGFETLDKLGTVERSSLVACAAEAQRLGKRRQAINIFQHVIATLDDCSERTHVPALIRSTICLLAKELENCKTKEKRTDLLDEICHAFEIAWNEVDKQESTNDTALKDDLEWLNRNAYYLALKHSKSSFPGPIMQLLDASTKLAAKYQHRTTPEEQIDINEHYIFCDFLKTIKIVSEARIQADPIQKRNHYQTTRDTSQNFRTRFTTQLQQTGKNPKASSSGQNDMTEKYRIILTLDFEAAIYLQHWSNLSSLIEETRGIATEKSSAIFMNAILTSDAPVREIIRVVKAIICTNHKSFPGSTLPRYLRVLFQLAISSSPSPSSSNPAPSFNSTTDDNNNDNTPIAETVLDQILFLARKSHSTIHSTAGQQSPSNTGTVPSPGPVSGSISGSGPVYPREELEWLASTTFNRAVDFYRVSADAECKRWAGKAIEVAELVDRGSNKGNGYNGVGLAGLLRGKLMVLRLD